MLEPERRDHRAPGDTRMYLYFDYSPLSALRWYVKVGLYRIFEYEIAPSNGQGQIDQADASIVVAKLDHNYGQIGLAYAEWLGVNHKRVQEEVEDYTKAIGVEIKTTNEERFWRVMVGTLLMGARYANLLGFTEIDEDALKAFLISVAYKMRTAQSSTPVNMKNTTSISNVFQQCWNEDRARNTLWTSTVFRKAGRPSGVKKPSWTRSTSKLVSRTRSCG